MDSIVPTYADTTAFSINFLPDVNAFATDTVRVSKREREVVFTRSMFEGHALKAEKIVEYPREIQSVDWIAGMFILFLVLLSWIRLYYHKRLNQIFKAVLSARFTNQLVREGNLYNERTSAALFFIFISILSLLVWQALRLFNVNPPGSYHSFVLFIKILGIISVFWFLKFFTIRLIGAAFKTQPQNSEYLLNMFIFDLVSGIVLFPFMVIIAFLNLKLIFFSACILLVLLHIYRVVRGFMIGISMSKYSLLYLIVYLCTLEILPLLVFVKWLLLNSRTSL